MPCPGLVKNYHPPVCFVFRVDSHLYSGYTVPPNYDSMIAKVITHGETREIALMRNVSERTVQRGWDKARIYLYESLRDEGCALMDDDG